jgi:hypothetical protein
VLSKQEEVQLLQQLVSCDLDRHRLNHVLTHLSGAAVIGDISTAKERAHFMGIFGAGKVEYSLVLYQS